MMELRSKEHKALIAYASAFASWLIPKIEAGEIILFGSAARGDFTKESDIDIFMNIKGDKKQQKVSEKSAQRELSAFYESKIYELWKLKDAARAIHLSVGNLDEWPLKRSIISNGIVLYGHYKSMPDRVSAWTEFVMSPIKNIALRNKVLRTLFGRKEKNYNSEGIVIRYGGKKLSSLSFIVPTLHAQEIIRLLKEHKIRYILFDLWTDVF